MLNASWLLPSGHGDAAIAKAYEETAGMLKRILVRGYKSLRDVEVRLHPLSVLLGPNAAGKSNFLDCLQLLSKLVTSRTIKEAFDPPYRGKPLESFSFKQDGLRGLLGCERLAFTIEADIHLSDTIVAAVNQQVRDMRRSVGQEAGHPDDKAADPVRERNLRYRIVIEMLPRSGQLRVADEYLAALTDKGEPTQRRRPFLSREGDRLHLRLEGQAHPTYYERFLDHSILSIPFYPPHYPHLVALRREMENWLFFYFEPRERMRAANPVKEVRHIGLMGEELAAYLNTLKALDPIQFETVEKSVRMLLPGVSGIEVEVSNLGEVELTLKEDGVAIPARLLSEGTLRILGLLALSGAKEQPSLVGFEEPENGVHPRRIQMIAELLKSRTLAGDTQYIVTTHSPILPDLVPEESLLVCSKANGQTRITSFTSLGPLYRRGSIDDALDELSVSELAMRGDLDA